MAKKTKKIEKKIKKRKSKRGESLTIPARLVAPVAAFLRRKLVKLEKRKAEIEKDDPFKDVTRVTDNASPDTDASEQFGHARVSAIKEQFDRRIIQIRKALARIKIGKYGICEVCGEMIDTDRLMAYPEATRCVKHS